MTPFAEDVLDLAPEMEEVFRELKFFDLNHRTEEIHQAASDFIQGDGTLNWTPVPSGSYWVEFSGNDRRIRAAYIIHVEGPEVLGTLIYHHPQEGIRKVAGHCYALFSRYKSLATTVEAEEGCDVTATHSLMMVAAMGFMREHLVEVAA